VLLPGLLSGPGPAPGAEAKERPAAVQHSKAEMSAATKSRRKPLSEKQRAERRAAERKQMSEAIEALQSSAGWERWLRARRHFRTYSLHNQLLIALQCPEATKVAGFRAWLELGYCVRKGEAALRIWAPLPPSKRAIEEWKALGADPAKAPPTRFRTVAVFDRSQVEPLPEHPGGRRRWSHRASRSRAAASSPCGRRWSISRRCSAAKLPSSRSRAAPAAITSRPAGGS